MLGVLRNRSGIAEYISALQELIAPALRQKEDAVVFFTLPRSDLQHGFVQGIVITGSVSRDIFIVIPESGANLDLIVQAGRDGQTTEGAFDGMPSRLIVILEHARVLTKPDAHLVPEAPAGQAAPLIADRLGRYVPHLGICFVDLIFGLDESPFFLMYSSFSSNLLEYVSFLGREVA